MEQEQFKREGHDNAEFFIGAEVEYTPAHGKRTLFVVGKQPVDLIIKNARENGATHIFMGANHYFEASAQCQDPYWDKTIAQLLDNGFWVSIEYQAHEHGLALKMFSEKVWRSRYFIPLLSVRIPHVQTSSSNLTIKIDDVNFKATNDGVWCLHHTEATDSNRFTPWIEYSNDEIVGKPVEVEKQETARVTVEELKTDSSSVDEAAVDASESKQDLNDSMAGLDTEIKEPVVEEAGNTTELEAAEAYAEAAVSSPAPKSKKAKKE